MRLVFLIVLFLSSLSANEKVVLQLKWFHQFQFAGYYAAKEKGFYEDVGLDVEIRERNLDYNNIEQVINGDAQYGVADSVLFLYIAKERPVVIVTPIFQHSPNVLVTLKSSNLNSPYKLESKKVLFYNEDTDGFAVLAMFENIGVKPHIIREKSKDDYKMLENGSVDANPVYLTNEPYYLKKDGFEYNIINPAHYGFDMYGDILFTNIDEATKHPHRVEKFKEATLKGWEYALEHKDEMIELIKKKYAKEKSLEHLMFEADTIENVIEHKNVPLGTFDVGRVEYLLDKYKSYKFLESDVDVSKHIFENFVNKESNASAVLFTKKEQDYLNNKKIIKMCIDPDWMPFEMNEEGKHIGMSADYFSLLQNYINIPIEMVKTKSWSESLEYGKSRKCDIFSLVMPTDERRKYLDFTKPYLSIPLVIVTNINEPFINSIESVTDKKIGIVKGYAYGEILRRKYPHMQLVDVENVKEGLDKVNNGELFGFIDTLATTGFMIQKNYIGQLKIAGKFDDKWNLGVGVRNDEPILVDIFNKAISKISTSEHQNILNKWISVNYDKQMSYKVVIRWILIVVLVFSVILGVIIVVNRRLKKEINRRKIVEQKLQELSITDELTQLYNRRYFNEIFKKFVNSALRDKHDISFAIFDVDYFKQYNDTYGHQEGDKVLAEIAKLTKSKLSRADDYCFRLGGEEFGLLFKHLTKKESYDFVEELRGDIENLKIEHESNSVSRYVTVSFGLVVKNASMVFDIDSVYKEADSLLYKAKNSGRNRVIVNED